jgi:hypothetical protein
MTARDWGLVSAAVAMFLDQATKILLLYVFGFRMMLPGDAVQCCRFLTWS